MLFFLRKLIEALLLPIGLSGLLTIAGIVFRRRWLALLGVAVLFTFSMPVTGRFLMRSLEDVYPPQTVAACPAADAIVVLSGGVVRGVTAAGVQWGESSNRYFAGLDLALAGKAKVIVFSAAQIGNGASEGALMRQAAIRQGISPERIVLTGRVLTTDDEAGEVSKIPDIHSIVLVTSAFHMARAVRLFEARGLEVKPFPTDQKIFGPRLFTWNALMPLSSALQHSEEALREYYGLVVYRLVLPFRSARH